MRKEQDLRTFVSAAAKAAIAAVRPSACIERAVRLDGERITFETESVDLGAFRRLLVVGMGKASAAMASAFEDLVGSRISGGLVVTADGYGVPTRFVDVVEAGHPIPDSRCLAAGETIASLAREAGRDDLVVVMVSGGGSSLMTLPLAGVTIEDLATANQLLIRSGVRIDEANAVRKHLSAVKGGRLAALAHPARVVSLLVSDVPGDRLDAIASGPAVPDPTTFADAEGIAHRAGIWGDLPIAVRRAIERGVRGEIEETPKPGDRRFERVSHLIVGNGRTAIDAARAYAAERGFANAVLTSTLEGEARIVGEQMGSIAREMGTHGRPIEPPSLLCACGETTVTVTGAGRGGRNQELALAAASRIDGARGVVVCSVGTDGVDGPTDAAGGLVDGETAERVRTAGLRIEDALAANASYDALAAAGDLVVTGPTMTNVADVVLIAASRSCAKM